MAESNCPLVTIVVPVWNAENYVETALRSTLGQTWPNLRLLVVNDGSTDSTPEILRRLSQEDPRLQVLSVANGGPAMARNRALEALPEGTDYVMFQDADDLLAPDAVEYALTGAKRGAELVIFGYAIRAQDGSLREYREPEQLLDRQTLGQCLGRLYKANLLNQVWGKLYSARLLQEGQIRFPDYRWGEDRLFVFDVLERAERIAILPQCKYTYVMHEGESLITRYYGSKFAVCCEIDRRVQALCRDFGVADDAPFRVMFAKSVFSCLTNLHAASCPLSPAEKRAATAAILGNGQVKERLRGLHDGMAVNALSGVVLSGSPGLNLLAFKAVVRISERLPGLVMRIKHRK